ncbi:MAG: hypothetical protein FWC23_01150 [Chitinispirillia bacterium]|nr:hypothetical protein [Chitinispirillia bacterium]MCL2267783.1 hypothetical protein [Chitinispirillia bacterium]
MFRDIYELFGLNPFFSDNMAAFLAGIEDLCADPYTSVPLYTSFGLVMLISSAFIYVLQYHIIDRVNFNGCKWWWIFASSAFVFNFAFAFIRLWGLLGGGADAYGCDEEFISVIFNYSEVGMFAFVNGIFGFIVFTILSWPPLLRRLSKNCYNTTPIPR